MKLSKKQWIVGSLFVCVVLVMSYFASGTQKGANISVSPSPTVSAVLPTQTPTVVSPTIEPTPTTQKPQASEKKQAPEQNSNVEQKPNAEVQTQTAKKTEPTPVEPQDVKVTDKKLMCTISVKCTTILNNIDKFNKDKLGILPKDGVILSNTKVTFYEGETVFNVLQRELKKNKIHMEFTSSPIYNTNYIEGIGNIYEFDCGELSGWTYRVNGNFANYGSSKYPLHDGDTIEWLYTCDLGRDVGNEYKVSSVN